MQQRLDRKGGIGKGGIGKGGIQPSTATTAFAVPPLPSLRGSGLERYDQEPDFAAFALERAGLTLDLANVQTWHLGQIDVVGELWIDARSIPVFLLNEGWPATVRRSNGKPPTSLALAEIFASSWTNIPFLPTRAELARWKRRALLLGGFVTPPDVSIAELPQDAPPHVIATWESIRELKIVRLLAEPEDDRMPLSAPFLARWCRLHENAVRQAKRWLERRGFIERAGIADFGFPRRCVLWNVASTREPSRGHH